jgi:hypothetical protein
MQRERSSRRGGHLSKPERKHVPGFEVLDEIDGFLERHSVFGPDTPSDFERERVFSKSAS